MNISLPIRFEAELAPACWSLAEAIPEFWSKIGNRSILLSVRVPKLLNFAGGASHACFPLEHLKPRLGAGLTNLKRRQLANEGLAALDDGQDEPFDVFLCHPAGRSKIVRADPRELQNSFFALKETPDLLLFLNRFGMWRGSYSPTGAGWSSKLIGELEKNPIDKPMFPFRDDQNGMAVTPEAIWHEQTLLREAMLAGSKSPERWFATYQPLMLEPVSTNPFYRYIARCIGDAIEALITFDLLQGSKFSLCKRTDCGRPFVANRRGRQFCSYDCAHLVAVRKSRQPRNRKTKGSMTHVNLQAR